MKSLWQHTIYQLSSLLLLLISCGACATLAGVDEAGPGPSPDRHGTTFPYDTYVEGRPELDLRVQGGFYLWRVGNTWSVRIAKQLNRPRSLSPVGPVIIGNIQVEDAIAVDMKRYQLSALSDARLGKDGIDFKFELRDDFGNDIEGFDFTIRPRGFDYCVTLDIRANGMITPGMVRLGSNLHIPDFLPLTVCQRSFDEQIKIVPKPKKTKQ